MTDDEETDAIWYSLTAPAHLAFVERMHELKGLVHYTDFGALDGIIRNEEIWFSPVMTMNDFDEILKGKRLLERLSSEGEPLHELISSIFNVDPELGDAFKEAYKANFEGDLFDTFVSCWSTCEIGGSQHDNLAMWRGYASEGNGAAIVIDPIALGLDKLYSSHIVACPVFYETEEEFNDRAFRILSVFLQNLVDGDIAAMKKHIQISANAFAEVCFHLAITHKHPGFSPEREWRFVWRRHMDANPTRLQYVKSKAGRRGLYEYFCFPIKPDEEILPTELRIQNVIREVMVGPTEDAYLKKCAVQTLLSHCHFDLEKTSITISDIPYRSVR